MFEVDRDILLCGNSEDALETEEENKAVRHAAARRAAAQSKSGLWGPTHSMDSDDSSFRALQQEKTNCSTTTAGPSNSWSAAALAEAPQHLWKQAQSVVGMNPEHSMCAGATISSNSTPFCKGPSVKRTHSVLNNDFMPGGRSMTPSLSIPSAMTPSSSTPTEATAVNTLNTDNENEDEQKQMDDSFETRASNVNNGAFCSSVTPPTKIFSAPTSMSMRNISFLADMMGKACSPCSAQELEDIFRQQQQEELQQQQKHEQQQKSDEVPLGISRMEPPEEKKEDSVRPSQIPPTSDQRSSSKSSGSNQDNLSRSSPADRRRQRHFERQQRSSVSRTQEVQEEIEVTSQKVVFKSTVPQMSPIDEMSQNLDNANLPCRTLTVRQDDAIELERSISELTMRSSHAGVSSRLSDQRRMAYYAVGRNHRQNGRGGNRRCYFSGKLIMSGAPFYAGSVQQGLRTLVVFCLPSALGLPRGFDMKRVGSFCSRGEKSSIAPSYMTPSRDGSHGSRFFFKERNSNWNRSKRHHFSGTGSNASLSRSPSRISSIADEMSSVLSDLDPNWGLDREYLLQVLPNPGDDILNEMSKRYPEQFETLPLQVRNAACWRLYVKFCFFSGLPIAEGELHYKVRDDIANEVYGEEIVLSHDVMEAVNGTSAEILRLPNIKTFRYLRKHYTQQSGKLADIVFRRTSWELVRAEV